MAVLLGAAVGFLGALVGAGGGFLLMPVLLLAYGLPPARAAAASLVMVAASSAAATWVNARYRRIDYRTGLTTAAFAIAGSLAGAHLASSLPVGLFSLAFGLCLAGLGAWLAFGPKGAAPAPAAGPSPGSPLIGPGAALVGGVAALFGIGGGPLLVPMLSRLGGVSVHRAAATAQLVVLCSAVAGMSGYLRQNAVDWPLAAALAAGGLAGAPPGAMLSRRLPAHRLLQLLGACLVVIGGRLVIR